MFLVESLPAGDSTVLDGQDWDFETSNAEPAPSFHSATPTHTIGGRSGRLGTCT
jgi:hypothetical protein